MPDSAPVVERLDAEYAVCRDLWTERKGEEYLSEVVTSESVSLRQKTASDIFAACFEYEPVLLSGCTRESWRKYIDAVLSSPGFSALRVETRLDECKTSQAIRRIAAGYEKYLEEHPESGKGDGDGDLDGDAVSAAGEALAQADADCKTLSDIEQALGSESLGGRGPVPGQRLDQKVLLKAFRKVRDNASLKRKFELAGRLREVASAKQRAKKRAGIDEIVGCELGNDVAKLLATELGRLGDEDLELDFLRRYVDRLVMQRHHLGSEKTAQGPVVCIVDESGSMCGPKEHHAKALALTLAWVAQHQKRWYCLSSFSGVTCGKYLVCAPGKEPVWYECDSVSYDNDLGCMVPGDFKELATGPEATLSFLDHFYSGGSNLDLPLDILPQVWPKIGAPSGKTDIVMITDCHLSCPTKIGNRWNEFRIREKARVQVYVVGGYAEKKDRSKLKTVISEFCDECIVCPADLADPNSTAANMILETV